MWFGSGSYLDWIFQKNILFFPLNLQLIWLSEHVNLNIVNVARTVSTGHCGHRTFLVCKLFVNSYATFQSVELIVHSFNFAGYPGSCPKAKNVIQLQTWVVNVQIWYVSEAFWGKCPWHFVDFQFIMLAGRPCQIGIDPIFVVICIEYIAIWCKIKFHKVTKSQF